MAKPTKFIGIQYLRCLAIVLVAAYHTEVLANLYTGRTILDRAFESGRVGVDIFFVISGFIMITTSYNHFAEPGYWKRFLYLRVTRIYPLYWLITAPIIVLWFLHPEAINSRNGGVDPLAAILLIPSNRLPFIPVGWTLVYEMYFYVIFAVAIAILARPWVWIYIAAWSLVALAGFFLFSSAGPGIPAWNKVVFSPLVLEFCSGVAAGLIVKKLKFDIGAIAMIAGVALFVLLVITRRQLGNIDEEMMRVPLYLLPSFLLVFGAAAHEKFHPDAFPRNIFSFLGDASYSVYLVHILIIHAFGRLIFAKDMLGSLNAELLLSAITFVVSIGGGVVVYLAVEKPINAYFREAYNRRFLAPKQA